MEKYSKQAQTLAEVDFAVNHNIPISENHPYFVDFTGVRGDFEETKIYKAFNVNTKNFTYDHELNPFNKTLLFLGGMRGSGKTSEIAKYVGKLDKPDCFFCVVCNIDTELDTDNIEYMDILILQIEKLLQKAEEKGLALDGAILKNLQDWFNIRIKHINKKLETNFGISSEIAAQTPSLFSFLKLTSNLKAGITGSKATANEIRTELKNNFTNFITLFNDFIETTNHKLREQNLGKEVFFVIDGIEKTMSTQSRRRIIIDESNRLRQIRANTLFTLPVELMSERQRLKMFSRVEFFPFVKVKRRDGTLVREAITKFEEFIYKRISPALFDDKWTVEKAIIFSGGSPRELLHLLREACINSDEDSGKITLKDLKKAINSFANETSLYLTVQDLELLKEIKQKNKKGEPLPYDERLNKLLETLIVMEYNSGTYKRVNPVVEASQLYKQYVGKS